MLYGERMLSVPTAKKNNILLYVYLPCACRPDDAVHPRLLDVPAQLCLDVCDGFGRQLLQEHGDVIVWHERQSQKLAAVGTKAMVTVVGRLQTEFLHSPA